MGSADWGEGGLGLCCVWWRPHRARRDAAHRDAGRSPGIPPAHGMIRPTGCHRTETQEGRRSHMVAQVYVCVEVAGCPTICQHCWAQGVPYPAMPFADIVYVLEEANAACAAAGRSFLAYP